MADRLDLDPIKPRLEKLQEERKAAVLATAGPYIAEMIGTIRGYLAGQGLDLDKVTFQVADDFSHVMVSSKSEAGKEGSADAPPAGAKEPEVDPAAREAIREAAGLN